ncbi:MAG TPA: carboxypeptidase-like regulatory domain-containing protein, partial [Flavisolibacter sp.]|nr:carboxypeptidase-like regulatory domain-containing protein [Flavisolibacter sp.]
MKNGLLLIVALFVALFPALAQNAVSGTVVDAETKLPLQGASVFAQNTTLGAVTAADGSFKLSLGKGGYELVISFTGYVSQRMNVEAAE